MNETVAPPPATGALARLAGLRPRDEWVALLMALTLAVYYFAPPLPVAALGALAFLALAVWRLEVALLAVILTAPLFRVPRATPFGAYSLAEFSVLTCAAAWAVRFALARLRPNRFAAWAPRAVDLSAGFGWPALYFLGAAVVSLAASENTHVSLRVLRTTVFEPVLYYGLIITTVRGPAAVFRFLDAFVLLGLALTLFSFFHYLFIGVTENADGVRRMLAVYHSPNALALFLGRVIPVAFALALPTTGRRGEREREGERPHPGPPPEGEGTTLRPPVAVYWATAVLATIALVLTFSRGAWLATLVSVAFVLGLWRRRWLVAAGGALLAAAAVASPFLPWERLLSPATTQGRLYVWQAALTMLRDHPISGIGLDNFLYLYPRYQLPEAWAEPDISHPHNILLDHWLSLGVPGVVGLFWLQFRFWGLARRLYRGLRDLRLRAGVAALMASMLAFLVHGLIDNSYFLIDLAFIFWWTVALLEVAAGDQVWKSL